VPEVVETQFMKRPSSTQAKKTTRETNLSGGQRSFPCSGFPNCPGCAARSTLFACGPWWSYSSRQKATQLRYSHRTRLQQRPWCPQCESRCYLFLPDSICCQGYFHSDCLYDQRRCRCRLQCRSGYLPPGGCVMPLKSFVHSGSSCPSRQPLDAAQYKRRQVHAPAEQFRSTKVLRSLFG